MKLLGPLLLLAGGFIAFKAMRLKAPQVKVTPDTKMSTTSVTPGMKFITQSAIDLKPIQVKNQLIFNAVLHGPPGWLGALVQYGQLVQSKQLEYLISHTDPYGDAGGNSVDTDSFKVQISDRTSDKIYIVGHAESPHPKMPMERIASGPFWGPALPSFSYKEKQYKEYIKEYWKRWDTQGYSVGRANWVHNDDDLNKIGSLTVKDVIAYDTALSSTFKNAQWLVWAAEVFRMHTIGKEGPTRDWVSFCSCWGILVGNNKRAGYRNWYRDMPRLTVEPTKDVLSRVKALVGYPDRTLFNDRRYIGRWHSSMTTIAPIPKFYPTSMLGTWKNWEDAMAAAQQAEGDGSAIGQYLKYFKVAFSAVMAFAGSIVGPLGSAAIGVVTVATSTVQTAAETGKLNKWKSLASAIYGVIERFAGEYLSDVDLKIPIAETIKIASKVKQIGEEGYDEYKEKKQLYEDTLRNVNNDWGFALDIMGGGTPSRE